jgi:glycosyltransferase involved in cell wall biosynthesis
VIVGKEGWLVQELAKRIRSHPELGERLFWFEDLDDDRLYELYCICRALLMASESEGFGLPLVEAARAKAPLIARDLPIMREVTGGSAFFFKGETAVELADSIEKWFDLFYKGVHPKPDGVPWRSWAQSSRQLSEVISRMGKKGKDPFSGLKEPL